jgi:pyridoxine kinase
MKRIVTIQDISCVGKCSLTVALPILSAIGLETAILPTAVLSTHTAFQHFTFKDLTEEIEPIADVWNQEQIRFDGIYTGYLGSIQQIHIISALIDRLRGVDTLVFIDPVMGDFGRLYTGFTEEYAVEMRKLCMKADIIVPNMTEVSFLLGVPYVQSGYDAAYVQHLLQDLCHLGTKKAIITGISLQDGKIGSMGYDGETNTFFSHFTEKVESTYHGTGDVFASVCVGALMCGHSLGSAITTADQFTLACIRATMADPDGNWYGVNFESQIPYLLQLLRDTREGK